MCTALFNKCKRIRTYENNEHIQCCSISIYNAVALVNLINSPCRFLTRFYDSKCTSSHNYIHKSFVYGAFNPFYTGRIQIKALPTLPLFCFYRPQTKLREGNIFTGICLFTGRGSDILPWDHNFPPGPHLSWTITPPPQGPQKRAVCILLECFLVFSSCLWQILKI